jgi:hypothetical protein
MSRSMRWAHIGIDASGVSVWDLVANHTDRRLSQTVQPAFPSAVLIFGTSSLCACRSQIPRDSLHPPAARLGLVSSAGPLLRRVI